MQKNTRQPAHHMIDEIHRCTNELLQQIDEERHQEIRLKPPMDEENDNNSSSLISFTWIAGHRDSIGNERAGALAKAASEHGSSQKNKLPTFLQKRLPISISAVKQMITEDTKKKIEIWWKRSPRFKRTKCIDPSFPPNKYMKITSSLNRRQAY